VVVELVVELVHQIQVLAEQVVAEQVGKMDLVLNQEQQELQTLVVVEAELVVDLL